MTNQPVEQQGRRWTITGTNDNPSGLHARGSYLCSGESVEVIEAAAIEKEIEWLRGPQGAGRQPVEPVEAATLELAADRLTALLHPADRRSQECTCTKLTDAGERMRDRGEIQGAPNCPEHGTAEPDPATHPAREREQDEEDALAKARVVGEGMLLEVEVCRRSGQLPTECGLWACDNSCDLVTLEGEFYPNPAQRSGSGAEPFKQDSSVARPQEQNEAEPP